MSIFGTILIALIFPLNSSLFFLGDWVQGKEKEADASIFENRKMDPKINRNEKFSLENVLPIIQFQPVRKDEATDLVLSDAHASVILDANSGTILQYQNGKERRQIASLTKMMTAVLVMENVKDLDELVTIDEDAVYIEGTKIGCPRSGYCISPRLKVGEKISVRNLLKAMLMNSANDAATALGTHIGGDMEKFVDMMNKRAKELGLYDTNFCTPSGLELDGREEECYSSAYDIGRVAVHSLKFDEIWKIFKLPSNTIIKSADGKQEHIILNTDEIVEEVPNFLGGKTGFTPLAGRSLLVAVQDPTREHTIVCVLLDDPYRWQDIKTMINWAFNSYSWQ